MPIFTLETNVKLSNPKEFIVTLSKLGADVMKKPEKHILVSYQYNEFLSFSGTLDPAFRLGLMSLDDITPENTDAYSKTFFAFLNKTLGVPEDRGYIAFTDPGRTNAGYKGTTFDHIFCNPCMQQSGVQLQQS